MFSVDKEYQRDPKLRPQDVKSLMVWIGTQPHLPLISGKLIIIALFCFSCLFNDFIFR